ncbi:tol-pal system protein YbgF [Desulfovibrio sp. OttesenSCG-928-M16]|nr:tol-pal system protein YbgF [Desulfovibrio sp. OttesenSCG-928-M16]
MSARVDRHDQQIQTLLSQVGQVEQVLPGQAEMWAQMQTMRQELNMLNGRMEELQVQTTGGSSGELGYLRDRVARLESVVRQMASQLAVNVDVLNTTDTGAYTPAARPPGYAPSATVSGTTPPRSAVDTPGTAAGATPGNAQALYDSGIKSFDQRRYKDAVASFKNFTATYPKHNLAGNAHFWEGESWFQLKDYARAALAYQEVIAKHPGSPKMQSAMLKQGIALHNAGKQSAARERLDELVKRYPQSPEATRAKKFLAENA